MYLGRSCPVICRCDGVVAFYGIIVAIALGLFWVWKKGEEQ